MMSTSVEGENHIKDGLMGSRLSFLVLKERYWN